MPYDVNLLKFYKRRRYNLRQANVRSFYTVGDLYDHLENLRKLDMAIISLERQLGLVTEEGEWTSKIEG